MPCSDGAGCRLVVGAPFFPLQEASAAPTCRRRRRPGGRPPQSLVGSRRSRRSFAPGLSIPLQTAGQRHSAWLKGRGGRAECARPRGRRCRTPALHVPGPLRHRARPALQRYLELRRRLQCSAAPLSGGLLPVPCAAAPRTRRQCFLQPLS